MYRRVGTNCGACSKREHIVNYDASLGALVFAGSIAFALALFEVIGAERRAVFAKRSSYPRTRFGALAQGLSWSAHGGWRGVVRRVAAILVCLALAVAACSALIVTFSRAA